jgi:hypothetical protein
MVGRAALHPTAAPNRVDLVVRSPTGAPHKPPCRRTDFLWVPVNRIKGAISVPRVQTAHGPKADIKGAIRRFKSAPMGRVTTSVRVTRTGPGQVRTRPRGRSGSMATTP